MPLATGSNRPFISYITIYSCPPGTRTSGFRRLRVVYPGLCIHSLDPRPSTQMYRKAPLNSHLSIPAHRCPQILLHILLISGQSPARRRGDPMFSLDPSLARAVPPDSVPVVRFSAPVKKHCSHVYRAQTGGASECPFFLPSRCRFAPSRQCSGLSPLISRSFFQPGLHSFRQQDCPHSPAPQTARTAGTVAEGFGTHQMAAFRGDLPFCAVDQGT